MSDSERKDGKSGVGARKKRKAPWVRPEVTLCGDVTELVQGSGKSGPNVDGDPQSTSKGGAG